ncbi:ciliogenesis and planar polarity effector 1 isoform X2 [Cheilinus undulatus]|nr:ciliogenesis and planar polarity effector 1 isoform X2 [Cheilinus undulatus]
MRVLLVAITGQVLLWECMDVRDLMGVRDGTVKGQWAHIQPLEDSVLPSEQDKEASQHTIFIKTELMGDSCLSAFVFTSAKKLIITCLKIQWEGVQGRTGPVGYSVQWATKMYPMSHLTPPCQPVKSRGALVPAFSPDGRLLAIVLNQRRPQATQVLFVSTQNFVTVSCGLGGCGSKKLDIPSKYTRSYWVGSVSWSPSGLFLACVLKRGSLLMLPRLGGLLTLSSSGCNVDFGPAHFLPLHPLVTYRPPVSAGNREASLSSSSLSVRDVLRQRYSVTWHPRLLYLIVSDGYMATVMRVLDKPSPALLLKTLLNDTCKDLEKASRVLDKSQIHVRAWLESVSSLNLKGNSEEFNPDLTHGPKADSVITAAVDGSTLPLFLQDQGTFGGTKELLEKMQTFFEDDSDFDGPPVGSHLEDCGHLEFASMFDTLHALDTHTDSGLFTSPDSEKDFVETERKTSLVHRELGKIQSKLLTAWAFGLSLGNAVENRSLLLKRTLCCVVRYAALLRLLHKWEKKSSFSSCLVNFLKKLLSFLPWDGAHSDGPRCLGLMVEFSKRLMCLQLSPYPDSHQTDRCLISSHSLSWVLLILQLVSGSLDHTYSLQERMFWSSGEKESQPPQLWPSDVLHVAVLEDGKAEESSLMHRALPVPQRPSSRLFGMWQWVYKIALQYAKELKSFEGCDGWDEEQQELSIIISQIQTALQATGERLEKGPALLSYPGEHLFLSGWYTESADTWRSQICEESNKSCVRSVFKQTQLCLALLYSLLSEYRLREAQELGDHMACLILKRAGHERNNGNCVTADSLPCSWLPVDLHSDTAYAVVQTLGRFMASYFTNQPLYILPPHHVAILPPLHLPHGLGVGRLVPLCQKEVTGAVRRQQLSEVWTVDYAQDLLLLGGLLPETVWLAYHLGDWKTAASLSLAYTSYCSDHFDFTGFRRRELHLPTDLEPESIFQVELEHLLGSKSASQELKDENEDKSFSDPLEGEDWDSLQVSLQEILKASVIAGVNVLSSPLSSLLDTAKEMCSLFPALVPNGLYLPSPPLYCPQPSPNTQDPVGTMGQFAEVASRHKVSGVLQRLLLLLKSARCSLPAAQWYISHLRRSRHILHKIKQKYSYPSAPEEEKSFPEGLMKFVTRSGFFRQGSNKDGHLDPDTVQTLICFRELCALCWMLHVRDQLSMSCRKYQAARQRFREQISDDSEVKSSCIDSLLWACRLLPFSCFLNAEEILQDILLSLVSELPPLSLVADTLVQAFPEEEESVRVPLREKYNSLLQSLRQCNVLEGDKEEMNELMLIVIQDKRRQRRKHLGRLKRHLGPPEFHLWEKEEEEEDRESKHGMAMLRQLSLGTTLSMNTLTDCGFPPVCSDGDTAENTSEAISPEMQTKTTTRGKKTKKIKDKAHVKKAAVKTDSVIKEETHLSGAKEKEQPSPPVVGTWEFELEDEEYLNFLELFLSYVLEKDSSDGGESFGELPLLKGFSSQLRERELHSLTFDVLTTIHRRQRDSWRRHSGSDLPVFRAGCCYKPLKQGETPEQQTSSLWSKAPMSRTNLSVCSFPGLRSGKQKGLFGLRQQSSAPLNQGTKRGFFGSETSPKSASLTRKQPESFIYGSSSVEAVIDLQQGLDPQLEAQFPELGRLLEWMVRWADRRVLIGHHSKKKRDQGGEAGGNADEAVVIRVKASAPAILTSLSLMQVRFTALLGNDRYYAHIQIPETQWTVAPVLQPEVERQLERESSVDTGYPASANTPITSLDHNLHPGELSASHSDDPEELVLLRMPLPNDQEELTFYSPQRPSTSQQLCLDDLDVTPEKEVKSSNSEGFEESSSVSNGKIFRDTPDASLKLADLDMDENTEDISSSASLPNQDRSIQFISDPEPQALPTLTQPEVEVHVDLSSSPGAILPNTRVESSGLQPQSSVAGASTEASAFPNLSLSTENPQMRQRLGEDLYRLVQNINYMSLMEVLGASFSNLQHAQQSSSLAQSNINSSHPCGPSTYATSFNPHLNPIPVPTTISVTPQTQTCKQNSADTNPQPSQAPAHVSAGQPDIQNSGKTPPADWLHHGSRHLPTTSDGVGATYQEMQPLSVQLVSPEIHFKESRKLIPSSQGLLSTNSGAQSAPAVPPSYENKQNDPPPQFQGLKLLQLHRPALPHQSASHHHHMLHTSNPSKKTEKENRNVSSQQRQLSFNHTHDHVVSQHNIQASERTRENEFSPFPPVFPAHTPAPMQALRLLRFEPAPNNSVTFPKIPVTSSSRSASVITVPRGEAPIKLLHLNSGPKMMLPTAAPSAQMARLMSMEELTKSVIARQSGEEAGLRLLRVSHSPESSRRATTALATTSSKRQKRRQERTRTARKAEVTFRPNESIIPTQEATNEPEKEEPTAEQEITVGQDKSAQPDYMLTGQRLLDRAMSTSAELHAFASTCKRPPECYDASTNTEPAVLDEEVPASVNAHSPKSQSSRHLQFVQDTEETPQRLEESLDQNGRQFISVLDLEDKSQHQDLPLCHSPETQHIPSTGPPLPTSAQLHILATSVLRSAAADLQPSVTNQEDLQRATTHTDIPEELPSCSYAEPVRVQDAVIPQEVADTSDSEICQAIKSQSVKPHSVSSAPPTVWFSSRLSELDSQLAALQNIADYLERDFSNSRMLVNTIEKFTPAPHVKKTPAVKKTVRLSVPQEAWMPTLVPLVEPNVLETEEENQEEEILVHSEPNTPERKSSFRYSTSPHDHSGPSNLHTPPRIRDPPSEASGTTPMHADENLGHSGLSDTAEILEELVKEGYLSQTDLDWSLPQTAHRKEQQESSWMSQRHVRGEDERRELRIWMRRKQREQLAVYQKHRESLKERERKPFSSSGKAKLPNKKETNAWRTREEKEKLTLLEQYNQRTHEAFSLANDISAAPPTLLRSPSRTRVSPVTSATRSNSAPPPGSTYRVFSVSADDKRSPKSGQAQPNPRPWTAEMPDRPSEDYSRRLGLHRPVTSLPKDRLSQVTRRGMLSDIKGKSKPQTSNQSVVRHVGHHGKTGQSKSPPRRVAVGRGILRMEETTEMNTWELSSDLDRVQKSNKVNAEQLGEQHDGASTSVFDMDWLDNLSETGSSLSKIDWAAIERLAAGEETE